MAKEIDIIVKAQIANLAKIQEQLNNLGANININFPKIGPSSGARSGDKLDYSYLDKLEVEYYNAAEYRIQQINKQLAEAFKAQSAGKGNSYAAAEAAQLKRTLEAATRNSPLSGLVTSEKEIQAQIAARDAALAEAEARRIAAYPQVYKDLIAKYTSSGTKNSPLNNLAAKEQQLVVDRIVAAADAERIRQNLGTNNASTLSGITDTRSLLSRNTGGFSVPLDEVSKFIRDNAQTEADNKAALIRRKQARSLSRAQNTLEDAILPYLSGEFDELREEHADRLGVPTSSLPSRPSFFKPSRLLKQGVLDRVLLSFLAGNPSEGLGATIGGVVGGAAGASTGSLIGGALAATIGAIKEFTRAMSEAANEVTRSSLGIAANLSVNTVRFGPGGERLTGLEEFNANFQQAQGLQNASRRALLPLGISSEIANIISQSLVQGYAGSKGFGEDFIGTVGKRIGAFTALGDASLINNPTRFLKDLTDITNQQGNAKNTQLGARLSKVAPDVFTAKTAEELEKATVALEKYVSALESSDSALTQLLEIEGKKRNLEIEIGQGINDALLPAYKELNKALEEKGLEKSAHGFGNLLGVIEGISLGPITNLIKNLGFASDGVDRWSNAIKNFLTKLGIIKEEEAKPSEQKQSFAKALNQQLNDAGIDPNELAKFRDTKSALTTNRISLEAFNELGSETPFNAALPNTGEEYLGAKGFLASKLYKGAVTERSEQAKLFNKSDVGDNLAFLRNDVLQASKIVEAAKREVDVAEERLKFLRDSNSNLDTKEYKEAQDALAEKQRQLTAAYKEQNKAVTASKEGLAQFREALRATLDTSTLGGRFNELQQRSLDIQSSQYELSGNKNLSPEQRKLAQAQLDQRKYNLGLEAERLPLQVGTAASELALTQFDFNNLPAQFQRRQEALKDSLRAQQRNLQNFREDKESRRLDRASAVISAGENLASIGVRPDTSKLNLPSYDFAAFVARSSRALEKFNDSISEARLGLQKFKEQGPLRESNRLLSAADAVAKYRDLGGDISFFDQRIVSILPSADKFKTAVSSSADYLEQYIAEQQKALAAQQNYNQAFGINVGTVGTGESAEEQLKSFFAQIQATKALNEDPFNEGKVTHGSESLERQRALRENARLAAESAESEYLKYGPQEDELAERAKARELPNADDLAFRAKQGQEAYRQAQRGYNQGQEVDAEQERSMIRGIAETSEQLARLPLEATNKLLAGLLSILTQKQGLNLTKASKNPPKGAGTKYGSDEDNGFTISDDYENYGDQGYQFAKPEYAYSIGSTGTALSYLGEAVPTNTGANILGALSNTKTATSNSNPNGSGIGAAILQGLLDSDLDSISKVKKQVKTNVSNDTPVPDINPPDKSWKQDMTDAFSNALNSHLL